MADVVVKKPDGSQWTVDEALLTRRLPDEPDQGSFVVVTTATGTEEWYRASDVWSPVENAADTHPWSYVVARDTSSAPVVSWRNDDRAFLTKLIARIPFDGASVVTIESHRVRCVSNAGGSNVTVAFGPTVDHMTRAAATRFAIGLLGAVKVLP